MGRLANSLNFNSLRAEIKQLIEGPNGWESLLRTLESRASKFESEYLTDLLIQARKDLDAIKYKNNQDVRNSENKDYVIENAGKYIKDTMKPAMNALLGRIGESLALHELINTWERRLAAMQDEASKFKSEFVQDLLRQAREKLREIKDKSEVPGSNDPSNNADLILIQETRGLLITISESLDALDAAKAAASSTSPTPDTAADSSGSGDFSNGNWQFMGFVEPTVDGAPTKWPAHTVEATAGETPTVQAVPVIPQEDAARALAAMQAQMEALQRQMAALMQQQPTSVTSPMSVTSPAPTTMMFSSATPTAAAATTAANQALVGDPVVRPRPQ